MRRHLRDYRRRKQRNIFAKLLEKRIGFAIGNKSERARSEKRIQIVGRIVRLIRERLGHRANRRRSGVVAGTTEYRPSGVVA